MDERIFNFGFVVCRKIHGGVITVCFCSRDIELGLDESLGLLHHVLSTLTASHRGILCPSRGGTPCLISPALAPPLPGGARTSCPWRGTARWQQTARHEL